MSLNHRPFFSNIVYILVGVLGAILLSFLMAYYGKTHSKETSTMIVSTPDAVSHHTLALHGKKYAYTTRVGTLILYDKHDSPAIRVFYTANTLNNTLASKRPITFIYNGGPGSSSMLLRMAAFGPKRVLLNNHQPPNPAPYRLINNQYSLLDKTDMVFIDMPGTGFGRLMGKGKPADFNGVDKDVKAFSSFIQNYLRKNHRWNSPKYLLGESYGTTRTALLVNHLQENGTQINGVILLSSILNYGLMSDRIGGGDWQYVLYLPSLAATAWHFHATQAPFRSDSLDTLLKDVEHFATTDYLEALAQGSQISPQVFNAIAQKLHQYLGLPLSYIIHKNLRIAPSQFSSVLLNKKNQELGRFDARFTVFALNQERPLYRQSTKVPSDSSMVSIRDAILAMSNQYLCTDLHYSCSVPYIAHLGVYGQWDFRHDTQWVVNAAPSLANAIVENPRLKVFSGNGYYDFATPFFSTIYTLQHLGLPKNLEDHITVKLYSSGHMIYLDPKSLKQLKKDLDQWYDQS